jgi:hypothetical protein
VLAGCWRGLDSGPVRLGETLGDDVDSTRLGTGGHTTWDQDAGSWALGPWPLAIDNKAPPLVCIRSIPKLGLTVSTAIEACTGERMGGEWHDSNSTSSSK